MFIPHREHQEISTSTYPDYRILPWKALFKNLLSQEKVLNITNQKGNANQSHDETHPLPTPHTY